MKSKTLSRRPFLGSPAALGLAAYAANAESFHELDDVATTKITKIETIPLTLAVEPFEVEDSYIALPKAPGLGIDLDERALAQRPYRQFGKRNLKRALQEGP